MALGRILKMKQNKKGISAVVSNVILAAAVIAIGFSVLSWAQYQSSTYQETQSVNINNNINQVQERLSLEYTHYSSGNLKVYLMNSGFVNVTIQNVYLTSSSDNPFSFQLFDLSTPPAEVQNKVLNATTGMREGYIQTSAALYSGVSYSITVITSRGSSFVYSFVA